MKKIKEEVFKKWNETSDSYEKLIDLTIKECNKTEKRKDSEFKILWLEKEGYRDSIERSRNLINILIKQKDKWIDEARAITKFENENEKLSVTLACNKGKLVWIRKISKEKKSDEK